jgi:tRNA (guanine-N7-)-methyltransferase
MNGGEKERTLPPEASAHIRSYVIRAGRMTDAQRRALEELGPSRIIPSSREPLDPKGLFPEARPVVMEIGFGMGKATWQIALSRPEYNYLCLEVHSPGVGRLLLELEAHEIENIRIIQHDAVEVLADMIPPSSLAGFHIFYPDPWPKKRHHKRRLMRQAVVNLMIDRLQPGGYLYFVTDIEEYGQATLELLSACPALRNGYEGFAPRLEWRPETKFEAKATRAARGAFELYFTKEA